jgi:hypothetical protein
MLVKDEYGEKFVSTTFYKTFRAPKKSTNYALTLAGKCHQFDRSLLLYIFQPKLVHDLKY